MAVDSFEKNRLSSSNRAGSLLGVDVSTKKYSLDESLATADINDIEVVASAQINSLVKFYNLALKQSQASFNLAVIASAIAVMFFIASLSFFLIKDSPDLARISLISGALIEVISAIVFYLYKKTSDQLAEYRGWLDSTQRFLLANRVCDNMQGEEQQKVRAEIIRVFIKDINHSVINPSLGTASSQ